MLREARHGDGRLGPRQVAIVLPRHLVLPRRDRDVYGRAGRRRRRPDVSLVRVGDARNAVFPLAKIEILERIDETTRELVRAVVVVGVIERAVHATKALDLL